MWLRLLWVASHSTRLHLLWVASHTTQLPLLWVASNTTQLLLLWVASHTTWLAPAHPCPTRGISWPGAVLAPTDHTHMHVLQPPLGFIYAAPRSLPLPLTDPFDIAEKASRSPQWLQIDSSPFAAEERQMGGARKSGLEEQGWGGECCSVHGKRQLPPRRARALHCLHALAGIPLPVQLTYLTCLCNLSIKLV